MRVAGHILAVLVLTLLTQLGGLAWLAALPFRRRWLAFPLAYAAIWLAAQHLAPLTGRVPLPCAGSDLRAQSVFYCLAMRNFATPEAAAAAQAAAASVARDYPGTVTLYLDAGFPFLDGMPLVPHLSHDDGRKIDFAFFYAAEGRYLPGATRSPAGYFAFETLESAQCPAAWPSLRWDLRPLQPIWHDLDLEPERTRALIRALVSDPMIGKIFVEPPLATSLGVAGPKIRFQGCRAARHDDHIHAQLR